MNRAAFALGAVVALIVLGPAPSPAARAEGLGGLDGAAIVHAGSFSEEECPGGDSFDCSTWPRFFTRADSADLCFSPQIPLCNLVCNGMLVVDRAKQIRFLVLDALGNGIQSSPVTMYDCPD